MVEIKESNIGWETRAGMIG